MTNYFNRSDFPQQVSTDQAGQDRSEIAFSNGASFASNATVDGHFLNSEHGVVRNSILLNDTEPQETGFESFLGTFTTSSSPARPARHPDFVDYSQRLRSYARWTRSNPGPVCLCEAGFFYTNQGDLVRCFQCGIGLKDFSEGDDPLLEHVRHSGDCLYLLEHLGPSRLSALKTQCQDQTKYTEHECEEHRSIQQCRRPEYKTFEARVSSFRGWPSYLTQKPTELAEAGLYYTGVEDHVRCFACDGGLRRWDPDDVPWTEHCRWFPACPFARQEKGDEFIALVQASEEYNNQETGNTAYGESTGGQELSGAMQHMTLRDQETAAQLNEHKNACLEMGYEMADFTEAVNDLRNIGTVKPGIDEIIEMIDVVKERKERQQRSNDLQQLNYESPIEENKRLKSSIICNKCGKNNVNALFIPCTHHRLCMDCAEPLKQCPVCNRHIRQKIRTFLV